MLGATGSREAVAPLSEVADDPRTHFLIRRMAVEQLGALVRGRPTWAVETIPPLLRALYAAAPGNPAMRMNDVAALALVQVGPEAVDPLLRVLDAERGGNDDEILDLVDTYIGQVLTINPSVEMDARQIRMSEAIFTLGSMGDLRAAPRLQALSADSDSVISQGAMMALSQLVPTPDATLDLLDAALRDADRGTAERAHLLGVLGQTYDNRAVAVFRRIAEGGDELPVRYEAARQFYLLATAAEAGAFTAPEDIPLHGGLQSLVDLSARCNDVPCFRDMLDPADPAAFEKAASMLTRLGDREAPTVERLFDALRTADVQVRRAATHAIDRLLSEPTAAQAATLRRIVERAEDAELGRASWHAVRDELRAVVERVGLRVAPA
jgi:HEAT repeat protein